MKNKLREHILFVREHSPYYRELYKNIDIDTFSVSDLPILSQEDFWLNNGISNNTILTSELDDGVVFKSGGTTGTPKSSYFTQEEWEVFTDDFSFGMSHLKLKKGDRCANLFYSGDLYASFLFINKSVEKLQDKVVQFPVTGQTDLEETKRIIENFRINVLFGVPTSLINLANHFDKEYLKIDQIYYGGEPLFEDQREILSKRFPNAHISSIGYASVDGGQLGYVDATCSPGEHIVFDKTYMEIVDNETGEVITELDRPGKLIFTNLSRKLMPIVRYPAGDMATWSILGKKFNLLGRTDEGARIGPVTVTREDILSTLCRMKNTLLVQNIQLVIKRNNGKDYLHIYLGVNDFSEIDIDTTLALFKKCFYEERPMYLKEVKVGDILEMKASVVQVDDLVKNPRTGKLRIVIDERF